MTSNPKNNFYNHFCTKDTKYFAGWNLACEESEIEAFLNNADESYRRLFTTFYMYLEALEKLKIKDTSEKYPVSNLMSDNLWYHNVLLLMIGVIDQITKDVTFVDSNDVTRVKKLQKRVLAVMDKLEDSFKQDFKTTYLSDKNNFESYEDAVKYLYSSRNFFAHDIREIHNNTPQMHSLAISNKKEKISLHMNMPAGKTFLLILIAILRYSGFTGDLNIKSNKKYDMFSDFMSDGI